MGKEKDVSTWYTSWGWMVVAAGIVVCATVLAIAVICAGDKDNPDLDMGDKAIKKTESGKRKRGAKLIDEAQELPLQPPPQPQQQFIPVHLPPTASYYQVQPPPAAIYSSMAPLSGRGVPLY